MTNAEKQTDPSDGTKNLSGEALRARIAETREHISSTLDALGDRLDPHHLGEEMVRDALEAIGSRAAFSGQTLLRHVRRHPVSASIAGAVVLLLLVASLRAVDEPNLS